jgi:hypothetical protein
MVAAKVIPMPDRGGDFDPGQGGQREPEWALGWHYGRGKDRPQQGIQLVMAGLAQLHVFQVMGIAEDAC